MKGVFSCITKYVAFNTMCSVTSIEYLLHARIKHPSSTLVVQKERLIVIRVGKRCRVFISE
jgi:hypothetical protein